MKKTFFRTRSLAEKKKLNPEIARNDLVNKILNLEDNKAIIIPNLIPPEYSSSNLFLKHGPDVKLTRFYSQEALERCKKLPYQFIEKAFNDIYDFKRSYYSFKPIGVDSVTRGVLPVDLVDAVYLYYYSVHNARGIEIMLDEKNQPERVDEEGASMVVRVSSRTEKKSKHEFSWMYFPLINNKHKHGIALSSSTYGHNCGDSLYNKGLRYKRRGSNESSRLKLYCAHEIAAYWGICEHYIKQKNKIPLEMSYFAIPTELTIRFDKKVQNNVIIMDRNGGLKEEVDKGNRNILIWDLISLFKYKETFFVTKKLKDYIF